MARNSDTAVTMDETGADKPKRKRAASGPRPVVVILGTDAEGKPAILYSARNAMKALKKYEEYIKAGQSNVTVTSIEVTE